jgi:hypothetical protein
MEIVMETYRYIHAKSSWMSAREALQLAEKLAEMGAEDGNIDSYMRQGVYGEYLREAGELEFGTSDFIATVPLVYMILNGVELILKGCFYATHPDEAPAGPLKLPALLESFSEGFKGDAVIEDFVRTYTKDELLPELLTGFLQENGMSLDDLYGERRFLNTSSFYHILDRYGSQLYTWEEGRPFYQKVLKDTRSVLPLIEELQADIDSDGIAGEKVRALRS